MKVKIGKYEYEKSTKKGKKLMVKVKQNDGKIKTIHFGNINYQHFKDKTGFLPKSLNHGDKKRRDNYLKRSKSIKNKKKELTYLNPESANYHSVRILWNG